MVLMFPLYICIAIYKSYKIFFLLSVNYTLSHISLSHISLSHISLSHISLSHISLSHISLSIISCHLFHFLSVFYLIYIKKSIYTY